MLTGEFEADYKMYMRLIAHEDAFAARAEAQGRLSIAKAARAVATRYRTEAAAMLYAAVGSVAA